MIVNKLYLITCTKDYPAYAGDSTTETVKLLVPSNSKKNAEEYVLRHHLDLGIDRISDSKLLYELIEGTGVVGAGLWTLMEGFDNENIIRV